MKTVTYDETKWKLAPIEPTEEMIDAAVRDVDCQDSYYPHSIFGEDDAKQAWTAMLSAAPAYNGKKDET